MCSASPLSSTSRIVFLDLPKNMGFSAMKRKSRERDEEEEEDYNTDTVVTLSDLNEDVLERVLSWLPTSSYFRMTSVCKRWKSTQTSTTFKLACSQVPSRDPWFFMISNDSSTSSSSSSFVYDSTDNSWRNLNRSLLHDRRDLFTPVASSAGLLCFRCSVSGGFLLRNPFTGSSREIPCQNYNKTLQAVAMTTITPFSYKLVTISGDIPNLCFKFYESSSCSWSKEFELVKKSNTDDDDETGTVYFLSKTGNVVVAASNHLQRSPSKQYSSVITVKDNVETVYFLSSHGTIIACDLTNRTFTHLPKLLPPFLEYSIDLVECNGTMFVVLLSEFYESASLRIWKLEKQSWVHVGMLPPSMSHELYGRNGDINCVGGDGDKILVCFNGNLPEECYRYFVYDLVKEEWSELPRCFNDGEAVEFVSALSFQPRIEATV
ncbi:F-box only protein 13 [Raphanus sativus]|uniref:F-box only protein 13 n=1 Tax=Raphanus sativus TaxID=3726 RepID=A0A6J0N9G0_RAPSA|nr:F-box only protein 13 [Raphanus sativus]KAJ4899200.1 F-box only protein 13 [Raphanus sativus]